MVDFPRLLDLADVRNGALVESASDDFFAPKERLILSQDPVSKPDLYTESGKWMDGWETRRRRTPGNDWCIVRLGFRGLVRGVDIDTRFFDGNHPEEASIEALDDPTGQADDRLWSELIPRMQLAPNAHNRFEIASDRLWTHIRLNIFPDGGVARLRVYGEVHPDWPTVRENAEGPIDLICIGNGGLPLSCSDEHFGRMMNLLRSDSPENMGDGWETRRRRGPGHDWVVIRLGRQGHLERLEVYTTHFKGNYPERCSVDGCICPSGDDPVAETAWKTVAPETRLGPDARHVLTELVASGPFTHLRLNIFPDGGIARFRAYGLPQTSD